MAVGERHIKGPAIGLLIVGILNLLAIPAICNIQATAFDGRSMDSEFALFLIIGAAIGLIGILQVLGALRMRRLNRYGLAVTASILAMIVWPGSLIGLPIGIWALVVLSQREMRVAFWRRSGLDDAASVKRTEENESVRRSWCVTRNL